MAESPQVDELDAFTRVLTALRPLDVDTRTRVLAAVTTLLGDAAISTRQQTPEAIASNITALGKDFFTQDRRPSPKQFLIEKRPRTDVDRVACLAYYLAHFRDQPQFKTVDLSALNAEAAQPKLSNAAQAVDNATKSALLIPAGGGQKQLSAAGELYVQQLPDYESAKGVLTEHRQPRKRKQR